MTALRPVTFTVACCLFCLVAACSSGPEIDEEFPPGNPVLGESVEAPGDNPVVGSDGNGLDGQDSTDYTLLAILALCLIAAGVLLVSVERWERRRAAGAGDDG